MIYEFEGKTERDAIDIAVAELGLEKDQFDVEILEIQKNSLFKKGYARIRVHVDESLKNNAHNNVEEDSEVEKFEEEPDVRTSEEISEGSEKTRIFIQTMIEKIGYDCSVSLIACDKKHFSYRINSKDAAMLIGKKGKNLDAIQLLANVYAGTIGHAYTRVSVDCESYRMRREELLVRMAYDVADKVRMTKKSQLLEPLNPYERRIIHTTLNAVNDIETKSEGSGLYKQVRVFYKGI
ncbi:RNA-binding cell elongation regulator Jag/EloR [Treponema putidum]|uniref:RNA-binding protein KhpB n=1 Tax=Treponema putidum TaxID=221027 RepID=A0AAE9MVY2_9SPIR|nr:RNA-binding cell elongation regulator Jag/EloR [Treponema putidum]AIN94893.1 single-stranded DNA-binding protein [Treponema putidum]TWI77111.1 spoIIIJ-associated protein [Treponema putidum]UTY28910.1 protein jag [Treponema putidum]UTY33762.1 protein jag [Treponema putidum]